MNERTYLKRMSALTRELERTQNAEPYDPDAYNKVIDKMNSLERKWSRSQLRKHWITLVVWLIVVLLLLLLIFFGRH